MRESNRAHNHEHHARCPDGTAIRREDNGQILDQPRFKIHLCTRPSKRPSMYTRDTHLHVILCAEKLLQKRPSKLDNRFVYRSQMAMRLHRKTDMISFRGLTRGLYVTAE